MPSPTVGDARRTVEDVRPTVKDARPTVEDARSPGSLVRQDARSVRVARSARRSFGQRTLVRPGRSFGQGRSFGKTLVRPGRSFHSGRSFRIADARSTTDARSTANARSTADARSARDARSSRTLDSQDARQPGRSTAREEDARILWTNVRKFAYLDERSANNRTFKNWLSHFGTNVQFETKLDERTWLLQTGHLLDGAVVTEKLAVHRDFSWKMSVLDCVDGAAVATGSVGWWTYVLLLLHGGG
ncbi:hypothetical protein LR48_Vigan205s000100 [Vigna angularis]|uniref:Uncharacterized protein n=1 Tax=Phaseolus angularis TaxID=3914 RepID=A0A0L9T6Y1_PHAAN|nr:hypothetical protein LR48_Vigan205s000100 [Vigna angularis]